MDYDEIIRVLSFWIRDFEFNLYLWWGIFFYCNPLNESYNASSVFNWDSIWISNIEYRMKNKKGKVH